VTQTRRGGVTDHIRTTSAGSKYLRNSWFSTRSAIFFMQGGEMESSTSVRGLPDASDAFAFEADPEALADPVFDFAAVGFEAVFSEALRR
jgi:hypothetical protein